MSTIKSSAENLTLNADGANNDVIIQSNGSTKVTVDGQNSRVGIGTASPTKKLEIVVSGTDGVLMSGANGYVGSTNDLIIDMDSNNDYSGNAIKFTQHNGASELMRIQDSGGISFNGDTAAANALNDYEEGTWTPSWIGGSPSGGNTTGYYLKVGNLVHIQYYSSATTIGSVSGTARLSNLPYAPLSIANHHTAISYVHGTAVTGAANCYLDYSNATIYWVANDSTSSPGFVAGSSKFLMITGTYRTA